MPEWKQVAKIADVKPGRGMQIFLDSRTLALFQIDGQFYALDDACTHAGASLAEGEVNGTVVTCPWHAATFDIKTGKALSDPADGNVRAYPVKAEGEDILIQI